MQIFLFFVIVLILILLALVVLIRLIKSKPIYGASINLFVLFVYLLFSSMLWAPIGQEGLTGGPGDPFIWFLLVFPILVFILILDVTWLIHILLGLRQTKSWRPILTWLFAISCWALAIQYNQSRLYTGSDLTLNEPKKAGQKAGDTHMNFSKVGGISNFNTFIIKFVQA